MDGWLRIKTKLDTKDFDAQIDHIEKEMEEIEYKLKQADMGFEVGDTVKLEAQYEKLSNRLTTLKQKQADLNKADLSNVQKQINKTGKEVNSVIKKMGKWALGIFAIESAYGFVRRIISTISQYNDKIAGKIEYIQYALASGLQPVIEKLISWAYKLLQYINYIANAWFGVNLFANASADAMNKSAKSAKDMKKSLAGFDEMNTVSSSNASTNTGGISGMDLSNIQGNVPEWLKWIGDNKDLILATFFGIAGAITAIKLSDLIIGLGLVEAGLKGIQTLGIGLLLASIVLLVQNIIDFINDPSWENFIAILGDIAIGIGAIMLVMGNWWGLLVSIIGLVVKLVAENWDSIKEILGVVGSWIYNHIVKPVADFFVGLWNGIVGGVKTAVSTVKNVFNSVISFFQNLISKIVGLFKNIGTKVGDVVGSAFKTVINGILSAIENILNFPIKSVNKLLDVINAVPGINISKLSTFNLPRLKVGGIVNMPGHGVPIGGAITGEAGREGVIPLTDSQALEELGSTIGRYITINLTNNTNLDGRTISRQQSKVQANKDFVMNR